MNRHDPHLDDLSDEELAKAIRVNERVCNSGRTDPLFGRPSRETVLCRLSETRAGIAAVVTDAAAMIVNDLARTPSPINPATLVNYAGLRALASDDAAWIALSAQVAAPVDSHHSNPFGHDSDAEADAASAERGRKVAEAEALRPALVAQEKKRYIAAKNDRADRDAAAHRAMTGRV